MAQRDERKGVTRRTFLYEMAAIGVGTSMMSACASAFSRGGSATPGANNIGLQLYTVRDQLEKDFDGTLAKVAQIGYTNMEFAGYYNHTPEQVRATLDRLGMVSRSSHIGANLMRQDAAAQIRSARIIGQEYITLPSYSFARDGGIDAWKKGALEFNQWGALCKDAGIRLAYHNHAPEFAKLDGGPTGYDVLMRETDPALVDFEMDLYWTAFADQDPIALFAKYPGRFAMWHVKDLQVTGGTKGMTPVGLGTLDFRNYFAHAREAGLKHFFVEHDTAANFPGGSIASIQASYNNLHTMLA
ncbi:MAG: sugar phosphate isomerase/epimerase [bacterium]